MWSCSLSRMLAALQLSMGMGTGRTGVAGKKLELGRSAVLPDSAGTTSLVCSFMKETLTED